MNLSVILILWPKVIFCINRRTLYQIINDIFYQQPIASASDWPRLSRPLASMAPRIDDIILPAKDDDFDFRKFGGLDATFDEEEDNLEKMPLGFGAVDNRDVLDIDQIEADATKDDDASSVVNDHVVIRIESSSESEVATSDDNGEVGESESEIVVVEDNNGSHMNQINRGRYDSAIYDFASEDEPLIAEETDDNDETEDETSDGTNNQDIIVKDIKSSVVIRVCYSI